MTFNDKYCYNIRVIHKIVERGHENPQFGRTGDETQNWAWKNTNGLNGVPNSILDQNSGSNKFGPVIDTIFCAQKFMWSCIYYEI